MAREDHEGLYGKVYEDGTVMPLYPEQGAPWSPWWLVLALATFAGLLLYGCPRNVSGAEPLQGRDALVQAGYFLFFDPRLSADGNVSCGTCHAMHRGTSDGLPLAIGIGLRKGIRHSPAVLNAALIPGEGMFWDYREKGLFAQASGPIENPDEMGSQTVRQVANRINQIGGYRALFQAAYNSPEINADKMLSAIVAFEKDKLVATDVMLTSELTGGETLMSDAAKRGALLFKRDCTHCHPAPYFTKGEVANTGLEFRAGTNDTGTQKTTGRPEHLRAYKAPSLIGVTLRYPLSHNGAIPDVRTMVLHYAAGGAFMRDGNKLRDKLTHVNVKRLAYTAGQVDDLTACLTEGLLPRDYPEIHPPKPGELPR